LRFKTIQIEKCHLVVFSFIVNTMLSVKSGSIIRKIAMGVCWVSFWNEHFAVFWITLCIPSSCHLSPFPCKFASFPLFLPVISVFRLPLFHQILNNTLCNYMKSICKQSVNRNCVAKLIHLILMNFVKFWLKEKS